MADHITTESKWPEILQTLADGGMAKHPLVAAARKYYFSTGDPGQLSYVLQEQPELLATARRNIANKQYHLQQNQFPVPTQKDVKEKLTPEPGLPSILMGIVNFLLCMFCIDPNTLVTHALTLGPPGSGKSHHIKWIIDQILALKLGFNLIIPDIKCEYRNLLSLHDNLFVITPGMLIINPWEVPGWRKPLDHVISVCKSFVSANWLAGASLNALMDLVIELYRQRGVFDGSLNFPTSRDLYNALDRKMRSKRIGRMWDIYELLKNRLFLYNCLDNFSYQKGIPFDYFLNRNLVLEMHHGFSDMQYSFISTYIAQQIYDYHTQMRNVGSKLRQLMVIDECRLLFAERDTQYSLENPMIEITSKSREIGLGFWAASQEASSFHQSFISLARLKFAFPASSDKDLDFCANALLLNDEQKKHLLKLPNQRVAVCRYSGYPDPFLIEVPNFKLG